MEVRYPGHNLQILPLAVPPYRPASRKLPLDNVKCPKVIWPGGGCGASGVEEDGGLEDAGGAGQGEELDGGVIIEPFLASIIFPVRSLVLQICCVHSTTSTSKSAANLPVTICILVQVLLPSPLPVHLSSLCLHPVVHTQTITPVFSCLSCTTKYIACNSIVLTVVMVMVVLSIDGGGGNTILRLSNTPYSTYSCVWNTSWWQANIPLGCSTF